MFQCDRPEAIDKIHSEANKSVLFNPTLPAKVLALSYLIDDDIKDRSVFHEEFKLILDKLEMPLASQSITGRFGQGFRDFGAPFGRLLVTWDLHSRYYVYRFWHFPTPEYGDLNYGLIECPLPILDFCPMGKKLSSLDILVTQEDFGALEDIQKRLGGSILYGNNVLNSSLEVYTNFYPDHFENERYLICGKNQQELSDNLEFLVESVIRVENSYHSVLMPMSDFYEGLEIVHKLERGLSKKMREVNEKLDEANTEQMKIWLGELSSKMAQVTGIYEKLGHSISGTPTYEKIYKKTIEQMQEKNIPGIKPFSEFLNRKTMFISTDYSSFMKRIESLGKGISDVISILRTKIDLEMQEQNLKQLHSMDKTAKTQVKLQQMVEGVSLIILSYYMTGLANYVFKYLEKESIIPDADLATVCFIPMSFLIAYLVTKRAKSKLLDE